MSVRPLRTQCRGVTLVEILVALAVLAVLLAISAGALFASRRRAAEAQSLSNLRSHAQVLTVYDNDWRALPAPIAVGEFTTTLLAGGVAYGPFSYFDTHEAWRFALADRYYEAMPPSGGLFFPPLSRARATDGDTPRPYLLPCAFLAEPQYWNPLTRVGQGQFHAMSILDARYASAKTLLVEPPEVLAARQNALAAAFADGSCRSLGPAERRTGYERGDGFPFEAYGTVHFTDAPPLLHTIDGVRGRDVP